MEIFFNSFSLERKSLKAAMKEQQQMLKKRVFIFFGRRVSEHGVLGVTKLFPFEWIFRSVQSVFGEGALAVVCFDAYGF